MRGGDEYGSGITGVTTGRHSTSIKRAAQTAISVRIEYAPIKHKAKHGNLFE